MRYSVQIRDWTSPNESRTRSTRRTEDPPRHGDDVLFHHLTNHTTKRTKIRTGEDSYDRKRQSETGNKVIRRKCNHCLDDAIAVAHHWRHYYFSSLAAVYGRRQTLGSRLPPPNSDFSRHAHYVCIPFPMTTTLTMILEAIRCFVYR